MALSSENELSTGSGEDIETFDCDHTVCLLYKLITSPKK